MLLNQIVSAPMNLEYHVLYQIFPKCVLGKVGYIQQKNNKKKKSTNQRQIQSILELLKLWKTGILGIIECWNRCDVTRPMVKKTSTTAEDNIKRTKNLVRIGRYGDAMKALLSEGVAEVTPEIVQSLKDKHPEKPVPKKSEDPYPDSYIAKCDMVEKCMRSFPKDTGCGAQFLLIFCHRFLLRIKRDS